MALRLHRATRAAGIVSASAALFFSLSYVLLQLAEWAGWLGSAGGPESPSTPLGLYLLLTPSLLLGPVFLMAMVCLHESVPPARRVWSLGAAAFAAAYLPLIGMNYFVQLAWVAPRLASGRTAGLEPFLFVPFDSFLYAVDILGYGLMSVSTLLAALALRRDGAEGRARLWLLANGLLFPLITLQMYWRPLIWPAAFWALTFPAAMFFLAALFRSATVIGEPGAGGAPPSGAVDQDRE